MFSKRRFLGLAAMAAMTILILDSRIALEGARKGLDLCLQTVIPSLFPFLMLSNLLLDGFSGTSLPILQTLAKACAIPQGLESILIPAFLGGYPVGAQSVAQAWRDGRIERKDARRLLAFCNNVGPSFLFGIVGTMFTKRYLVWLLWGIQIGSALAWGYLTAGEEPTSAASQPERVGSIPSALTNALKAMGSICGWVILFRVLIAFLQRWFLWLLPEPVQILLIGLLELSNGCCLLGKIGDENLRFLLCCGMLSFGGICVILQTASVAGDLGMDSYLKGKLVQLIFSLTAGAGVTYRVWWLFPLLVVWIRLAKKAVAIHATLGYNRATSSGRNHYAVSKKDRTFLRLLPLWHFAGRRSYFVCQKGTENPGG